jgi:hypothetical protein
MQNIIKNLIPEPWKKPWRDLHLRIQELERRLEVSDRIVDILISEEAFSVEMENGMNGQSGRKEMIQDLFRLIPFVSAVETGTYMGQTTGYLASSFGIPVYSCELIKRYHCAAKKILRELTDIHLSCDDARTFLSQLSERLPATDGPVFFYLDAHWYQDLPLVSELELIVNQWPDFVALIDDFQVPDDSGYGFDDYGGCALSVNLIRPIVAKNHLSVFFPALASDCETGRKRGSALVVSPSLTHVVATSALVQSYDE